MDRAVKTAYESDWIVASDWTWLADNLRLPTALWVIVHAVAGFLALACLLGAVLLWRRHEGYGLATRKLAKWTTWLTLGLALVASLLRVFAATDSGRGKGLVSLAAVPNLLALATIAALAVAMRSSLVLRAKRTFGRQRANLVVALALVVALTLLGDTSGQAIDSIRSWSPLVFGGDNGVLDGDGAARLSLGLAAAMLLSLVLYESGSLLSRVTLDVNESSYRRLLPIGLVLLVGGGLLWWLLPFGPGIPLLGLLLTALALLDYPQLQGKVPKLESVYLTNPEKNAPEWIAVLPLLALASVSVTATVEAALSGGADDPNTWLTAVPAALLGAVTVLFTRPMGVARKEMVEPSWPTTAGVVVAVVVVSLVVLWFDRAWVAALYGLLWVVFFAWYAWRLYQRPSPTPSAIWPAYALPIAFGGGFAVLVGTHLDPFRTGQLLGVFSVTLVALASALFLLHFAVRATLRARPPRLLWWFGLTQVPVLFLVFVWWIGVGVAQTYIGPKTLHDVRLVDRQPVVDGEEAVRTASLEQAFVQWTRSQGDLNRPAVEGPVPLVLVAAHGGGIRAAYWTAAALDCMVGFSPEGVDPADLAPNADREVQAAAREATCNSRRRNEVEQRIAAKRIFIASGVSGGAVGLYAYARQLLELERLGDVSWIDERLSDDFAGPAIAWALFHDIPNRIFGFHPDTGAPCEFDVLEACWRQNRAAVLERTFDEAWKDEKSPNAVADALLRRTYDLQFSPDEEDRRSASLIPVLVMNATLTGGNARAVVSATDLGSWPLADARDPTVGDVRLPLAGTVEIRDALCESKDLRLSTAALLASRFPYVTPSGRVPGRCGGSVEEVDVESTCAKLEASICEGRFVDGGYADNSGLLTLVNIWPSLRELVVGYNVKAREQRRRPIAPMIVEIDNHYQAKVAAPVPSGGSASESLIPLETGFGSRRAMETFARSAAYRILPRSCTVTISPSLHPGLIAPLGWELSAAARADLRSGLFRPHPSDKALSRAALLRRVQARVAPRSEQNATFGPKLDVCLPRLPPRRARR